MAAVPVSPHKDVSSVPDYFAVFGLPRRFAIDRGALERKFYELSRETHPDRFAAGGGGALQSAVERMSLLNEAYRTLKDPMALRKYFLELSGFEAPAEKSTQIPAELAEGWFELQDALSEDAEAAQSKLEEFEKQFADLRAREREELSRLEAQIDASAGSPIAQDLLGRLSRSVRMQSYFSSLERDVARLLQRFGRVPAQTGGGR